MQRRADGKPARCSPSKPLPRRTQIDLALGDRGQLLVGRLFLVQRLLQNGGAIVAAGLLRPGDQAAVARNFVVLGGLRRVDQCGIWCTNKSFMVLMSLVNRPICKIPLGLGNTW